MGTEWKSSASTEHVYDGRDRAGGGRSTRTGHHRGVDPARRAGAPSVSAVLPVFLVAFVMIAFIGVPVFMSWWRNRG